MALKTVELLGKTSTYVTAFTTDGEVLLPDTLVEHLKYEGIEFIWIKLVEIAQYVHSGCNITNQYFMVK